MPAILKLTKGDDSGNLTLKQRRAITCVLSARTVEEGVKAARISKNQWYVWLKQPRFRAEFDQLKATLFDDAISRLRACLMRAVEALEELCDRKMMVNPPTRLKAAVAIIEIVSKADVESDLQRRIEALEQAQKGEKL